MIIGITGTIGAGKGTIVEYLVKTKGFSHFSVRGYLLQEIRRRELPENRDTMFHLANDLRALHGPSYVTDQLYLEAINKGGDSIIESIRTTGEIDSLRKKGNFLLLAVDAEPKIRYKRIIERASETDRISYDTFLENEQRESVSDHPGFQNLQACLKLADQVLYNNGTKKMLYAGVERALAEWRSGGVAE